MTKDQLDRLERLATLRTEGVVTESEFGAQKALIIGETGSSKPVGERPAPRPPTPAKSGYQWGAGRVLLALIAIPAMLLLIFRVVGGGAAVTALQGGKVPDHVSIMPAPHLRIDDVKVNDSCAHLGDYCVRVTCTVTNDGSAAGVVPIQFEYEATGRPTATATDSASVPVGGQRTVTHDFGEARLSDKASKGSCKAG